MAHKKLIFNILTIFFLLVLTTFIVSALGVTPAKKIVDFEEGLSFDSEFKIVNTGPNLIKVGVEVTGELAKYLTLSENILTLDGLTEKAIKYSLNIPRTVVIKDISAGNNDVYFNIKEIKDLQENIVSTSVGLVSVLRVKVPYGLKHIKSELFIQEGDAGTNTIFVIPIENLGKNNLTNVKVRLNILDNLQEVISLESKSISIISGERKEIRLVWGIDSEPGKYTANVDVEYDSEIKDMKKDFSVNGRKLIINSLTIGDVEGDVAKFEIKVRNIWNEELSEIYATVELYGLENNLIDTFFTSKKSILKGKEDTFEGYLDLGNMSEGEYVTKLTVHYGNKDMEMDIETSFYDNQLTIEKIETSEGIWSMSRLSFILISVLMGLIVINLLWFLVFKKKREYT